MQSLCILSLQQSIILTELNNQYISMCIHLYAIFSAYLSIQTLISGVSLLVKSLHVSVFGRHRHALHVPFISDSLEVSAAQKQVHLHTFFILQVTDALIYLIQFSMTTAFNCHLHPYFSNPQRYTQRQQNALPIGQPLHLNILTKLCQQPLWLPVHTCYSAHAQNSHVTSAPNAFFILHPHFP